MTFVELNAQKTHCSKGHPYEGRNLIYRHGGRACRVCRDDYENRSDARERRNYRKRMRRRGVSFVKTKVQRQSPGTSSRYRVGTITLRSRNNTTRAWIKTGEQNTWRPLAVVVWERENGPVPKGRIVHHRDHNSLNDRPGNLIAITRSQHLAEHRDEYFSRGTTT
jgi:hypothetical protein